MNACYVQARTREKNPAPLRRTCGSAERMTRQEHETLLSDTERSQGMTALRNNVVAAQALADAVRSTLGPSGLDKMLVDGEGASTVTNDGVTVLETAKVEHPTARMLIAQSSAQDDRAGDGTTSTVLLTAELLQNALDLAEIGIHPAIIESGYRMAAAEAANHLLSISRDASKSMLEDAVLTSLAGKSDEGVRSRLSVLAVEAATGLSDGNDGRSPDESTIKRIHELGRPSEASKLVAGLVLAKQKVSPDMPLHPDGGKVLLLDGGISRRKPNLDASFTIRDPSMLEALQQQEAADVKARVDAIAATGCSVLFARDGLDDMAIAALDSAGITAYRRVEKPDLDLIAMTTGATLIHEPSLASAEDLGLFESLTESKWAEVNHLMLKGSKAHGYTLIVRGTSKVRIEEVERCFTDAVNVACNMVTDSRVVPGGGATQVSLSRHLRAWGATVAGREQLAIEAFAAALETIPMTLATNAGMSALDELISLTATQHEQGDWIGLDLVSKRQADMAEVGVVEPVGVARNAILGATEAAVSVLRIDDVLWASQDPSQPDLGGEVED